MKKEGLDCLIRLFAFLFISLFLINLISATSSSVSSNPLNPPQDEGEYISIGEKIDIGKSIGFTDNTAVSVEKALTRRNSDGSFEIILNEGGQIKFSGDTQVLFGEVIDSSYFDLSKKNRFVFKDGVLIEAEFKTRALNVNSRGKPITACATECPLNSESNSLMYIINGALVSVPLNSQVNLKNNNLRIVPKDGSESIVEFPRVSGFALNNPLTVTYVTNGKNDLWLGDKKYAISLRDGEITFKNNEDYEMVLKGNSDKKIVFGDLEESPDGLTKVGLRNMEVSDLGDGISLFLGRTPDKVTSSGPYIIVETRYSSSGNPGKTAVACAIGCDGPEYNYVSGIGLSIYPGLDGNVPNLRLLPGNPIFPGMGENQFLSIDSASDKVSLSSNFIPTETGKEKVESFMTIYGSAKIDNGNYVREFKKNGENKIDILEPRILPSDSNPIPLTITPANQKGSLIQYDDVIQIPGKPLIIVRNFPQLSGPKASIADDLKYSIISGISENMKKFFGETVSSNVEDILFNLFFPKRKPRLPV